MKRLLWNGFYIVHLFFLFVVSTQREWQIAILLALLLILIVLDQMHDTLKAAHGIKE